MSVKRSVKKLIKRFEANNSFIWVDKEDYQPVCMILCYNGVTVGRVSEIDGTVMVEFMASMRQCKRIQKDLNKFNLIYNAANWAC